MANLDIMREPRPVVFRSHHVCCAVESHVGRIMYRSNDMLLLVGIFDDHPLLMLCTDLIGLTEEVGFDDSQI